MRECLPRRVRELSRRPSRIFRAYLAEDYDGIGQYISITLSQGSSSKALKGRIASGDFGGSRIFPEGTPVVVASYRGQLEVFLGNQDCGITDLFNRDETNSWGISDAGVEYGYVSFGGPLNFSGYVNGTAGVLGSGFSQFGIPFLRFVKDLPVDMQFVVSGGATMILGTSSNPLDSPYDSDPYTSFTLWDPDEVSFQVHSSTGWSANPSAFHYDYMWPGFDVPLYEVFPSAEPTMRIRWQTELDTSRIKLWKDGTDEPDDWFIEQAVGTGDFTGLNTLWFDMHSGQPAVQYAQLDIIGVNRCTQG